MMAVTVMMVSWLVLTFNMALNFMAMLVLAFKLKGYVSYAVFCKLFTHQLLYLARIFVRYNMNGRVMILPIHTPYMNMMNVDDTVDFAEVLLNVTDIYAVRCFFKEKVKCLL